MATIQELESALNATAASLPKVTSKKMFGCFALWADGNVFALVWKHGRIGVKLPQATDYAKLMEQAGAEPWKAGPMTMAHWVLVPETFHSRPAELKKWAVKAHALCVQLPKKPARPMAKAKKSAAPRKAK